MVHLESATVPLPQSRHQITLSFITSPSTSTLHPGRLLQSVINSAPQVMVICQPPDSARCRERERGSTQHRKAGNCQHPHHLLSVLVVGGRIEPLMTDVIIMNAPDKCDDVPSCSLANSPAANNPLGVAIGHVYLVRNLHLFE